MKRKNSGIIFYTKKIKDNDLFIKILSSNDEINSGMVYGGNSSKKKLIYQNGYFIDYSVNKKHYNAPFYFTGEIISPFLANIFDDKYKLNALLSILSLINVTIIEGQKISGYYQSVYRLINDIISNSHWIIYYCIWLFDLLKLIGYQIDYKGNINKKYFDISKQDFSNLNNPHSVNFPHSLFSNDHVINYNNLNLVFLIFENIFLNNHLDNDKYKLPKNFINFKNMILSKI